MCKRCVAAAFQSNADQAEGGAPQNWDAAQPPSVTTALLVDALLYDIFYWGPGAITYSVPKTGSAWPGYDAGSEPFVGYETLSPAQATAIDAAFAAWDALIDRDIVKTDDVASPGMIRVAFTDYEEVDGFWGYAYAPAYLGGAPSAQSGDIWINPDNIDAVFAPGDSDYSSMLHEIGHALGLKHPFETPTLPAEYDTLRYTVMSYTPPVDGAVFTFMSDSDGVSYSYYFVQPSTPMVLDIAAVQARYGADPDTNAGDTVYAFDDDRVIFESVYDAGGVDTFDLSAIDRPNIVDLRPGAYSSIGYFSEEAQVAYWQNVLPSWASSFVSDAYAAIDAFVWADNLGIAFATTIENAIGGSVSDTLSGNSEANELSGMGGDDILLGLDGDDLLNGGTGNDWLDGGAGDDRLYGGMGGTNTLRGDAGTDLLVFDAGAPAVYVDLSAGAYVYSGGWDALVSIEGVVGAGGDDTLLGDSGDNPLYGGDGDDTLVGAAGHDLLFGEDGDDWLVGGAGDDLLAGGAGVNVLIGDDGLDLASYETAASGVWVDMAAGVYSATGVWDVFFVSIEGALGSAYNDNLFGSSAGDTLRGGAGDDALIGLDGDDVLEGGDGDDWLVGFAGNDRLVGGAGVDVLTGGAGADVFDLGTAAGWDVAFDFDVAEDRFDLGGLQWLGFLTIDALGDGTADDTLLGYDGGNFVALGVSGLTLEQWNALVDIG
jgi:Ca2+-binding RTX toxin-like protein